jgi:MFS family permease
VAGTEPSTDSLWRDRSFVLFWLARTVSISGSAITLVVLPILIFQLTSSAAQTALLTTLESAPYLLFGLFAGALADRVKRKRLMVGSSMVSAALLGSIPLAAAFGGVTLIHIYLVSFTANAVFVWFDAANFGALPALVGRERLVAANSAITATSTVIGMVGPAVGGFLAATIGPATAITFDALSFALAAGIFALISRPFEAARPADAATHAALRRVVNDIGEGLRFLWGHRLVRALTLLGFGNSLAGGALIGLIIVFGVRSLQLPAHDSRLGLFFTAEAIGALVASLLLPHLVKRMPVGLITLVGLLVTPLLIAALAVAPLFSVGLIAYGAWSACYSLIIINGISLRQIVTPEGLQSRVNTTARMIAWGGTPFGAAVGGILAEALDVRAAYLVMAAIMVLCAIIAWFSPLRQRQVSSMLVPEQEVVV